MDLVAVGGDDGHLAPWIGRSVPPAPAIAAAGLTTANATTTAAYPSAVRAHFFCRDLIMLPSLACQSRRRRATLALAARENIGHLADFRVVARLFPRWLEPASER